jgi:DNA-binding Lrp family transcriptional regulator
VDQIDRDIINGLQGGLEICERPYLEAAQRLGLQEDDLIARLSSMLSQGVLTRIGPLFQIERMGGAFTLAALHAPAEQYEQVAQQVNALSKLPTTTRASMSSICGLSSPPRPRQEIDTVIAQIERETGCSVFNFPKSREYFVELKLKA